MKLRLVFGLAAVIASAPMFASAAPIIYHVDYENNGVLLIGTITTDGKLGTLASNDFVNVHLLVSNSGLPGFILLPWGYTQVEIQATPVTATADGLYFDTSQGGYMKINDNLEFPFNDDQRVLLQGNTMTIEAEGEPISGNYEFATFATPTPPPVPPVRFSAESDAIFGTVTTTAAGWVPNPTTILPQAVTYVANQFVTNIPNPSHTTDSGESLTTFGVLVYNLLNIDDFAQTDYNLAVDDGVAEAKTGAGSLLGGLIYWQSHDDRLACKPDANITNHVDCAATEVITGMLINRVAVHLGKYPAGTAFPVFGPVTDPNCGPKQEAFSGYLITQESRTTGLGTSGVGMSMTGMHLVGDATCVSAVSGRPPFTTHYDLAVGGPSLPSYDSGSGNSAPPNTAYAVQLQ
jgi:hypothetical protein